MRTGFTSIREILGEVYRQGGDICKDITEEDVILDTVELIGVIGMPALFVDKVENKEVKKYRTQLPCDVYEVKQVRCGSKCRTLNASTDVFNIEESKTNVPTYKIQGNIMLFSFEEGDVDIAYTAFMLDDDNLPMVPSDELFKRTLVSYIIYKRVYNDYINGRVPNEHIMERVENNYELNVAMISHRLKMPSMDEYDNVARMMNSFIFRNRANNLGYKNIGDENISSR